MARKWLIVIENTPGKGVAICLLTDVYPSRTLEISICEECQMNNAFLKLYVKMQTLMMQEEGQDLVEYALVLSLIVIGSVAILKTIGTQVTSIFAVINSDL